MAQRHPVLRKTHKFFHDKPKWWKFWDQRHYLVVKIPYHEWVKRRFFRRQLEWLVDLTHRPDICDRVCEYCRDITLTYKYVAFEFSDEASVLMFKLKYGEFLRTFEEEPK